MNICAFKHCIFIQFCVFCNIVPIFFKNEEFKAFYFKDILNIKTSNKISFKDDNLLNRYYNIYSKYFIKYSKKRL